MVFCHRASVQRIGLANLIQLTSRSLRGAPITNRCEVLLKYLIVNHRRDADRSWEKLPGMKRRAPTPEVNTRHYDVIIEEEHTK